MVFGLLNAKIGVTSGEVKCGSAGEGGSKEKGRLLKPIQGCCKISSAAGVSRAVVCQRNPAVIGSEILTAINSTYLLADT